MNQIQAIIIVIEKEGRYLLGKRSPWKAAAPGYWCPVSGKIEPGESESEAVKREAMEEVGLKVEVIRKLTEMDTRDKSCRLHWYLARILEGEAVLKNDEHTELGWFSLDEMEKLDPVFHEDLALFRSLVVD